jgi:NADH-quinone oxidoreductase subunit C
MEKKVNMDEVLQATVNEISRRFNAEGSVDRSEVTLVIAPEQSIPALQALRDEFKFDFLIDVTAVDYWPAEEPRFHIIYHILSTKTSQVLRLRVPLNGNDPTIPSAEMIWPNANWYEREVWDMFGIRFEGHSDLRRIIMPYDWEGHPLRKDYPLGYEEVQFTFNFEEIMGKKPHPEERT